MATIKSIKVGETVYDLKAIYDGSGNIIDQTYAKSDTIPTKVSQLENDSNYLTEHQDISRLATKEELENAKLDLEWRDEELYSLCYQNDEGQKELKKRVTELISNVDLYSYGVEWDITVASPELTRIGNPLLHKSLPIQSAYRGCVSDKYGLIKYYLYPDDWNYKEDGITPSVLDGTDGVVRVRTPKFYGKSGGKGNKRWVRISLVKIDDSWDEIPEMLIDAYRCTVDQSTNKAVSVVNTTANYRGGSNRSDYDIYLTDDPCRSDLGKPRTNLSRDTMRTYAKNANSELLCYEYYKWVFYWAYVIEYANFNSQAPYNAELTSDGYRQGGLGPGVTTSSGYGWGYYNDYNPITPCGYCNEIGNNTGVKPMTIIVPNPNNENQPYTYKFQVPRWRGFDNPFGDTFTNLDGIVIQKKNTYPDDLSLVYTSTREFTDEIGTKIVAGAEVNSNGYTKTFQLGETGEIIPFSVGGSESTYMCDYHSYGTSPTALRTLLIGGGASHQNMAGIGYFDSGNSVYYKNVMVGFRSLRVRKSI